MARPAKSYTVLSANPKGRAKNITVQSSGKASVSLRLHRFAVVGKNDRIRFGATGTNKLFVVSSQTGDDDIPLTPIFCSHCTFNFGKDSFDLSIREIKSDSDMQALHYLEQFHYKTSSAVLFDEHADSTLSHKPSHGGRRAVLIAEVKIGEQWLPAGYIDLQMPLMMCKPRHVLFDHPYSHPSRNIAWKMWDQHAMKKYLNTIVRIARIVVNPELRGIGIARRIIDTSKVFASERWHIGGIKPIFMEISAEMLNHIDFVSPSGFVLIGNTEGNASRIVKDMEQMNRLPKGDFGIMTLQRKYYRILDDYCKTIGISFEAGLEVLAEKLRQNQSDYSSGEWAVLRSIIRSPVPYYLCPLDNYSGSYLRDAMKSLPDTPRPISARSLFRVKDASLNVCNLSIRAQYVLPETKSTQLILSAFGIDGNIVSTDIVRNLSFKASGGNIVLIVGASGSGKSALLNSLDPNYCTNGSLSINHSGHFTHTAGWLRPLKNDMPVFEVLAEKYTPNRAFMGLSNVGLSDALVFLKPFWMLSRGQQYRTMIADLLLRNDPVCLLDEFCSDLDSVTAKIVAHNLRKQIISSGRIAIVAAANHSHFLDTLRPTKVVCLRTGAHPALLTYKEYSDVYLAKSA